MHLKRNRIPRQQRFVGSLSPPNSTSREGCSCSCSTPLRPPCRLKRGSRNSCLQLFFSSLFSTSQKCRNVLLTCTFRNFHPTVRYFQCLVQKRHFYPGREIWSRHTQLRSTRSTLGKGNVMLLLFRTFSQQLFQPSCLKALKRTDNIHNF